jgi:hypothetical protein
MSPPGGCIACQAVCAWTGCAYIMMSTLHEVESPR